MLNGIFLFTGNSVRALTCEQCGRTNPKLEIHHTKTIRNKNWQSIRNKKTIVLCQSCHRFKTNQQIQSFNQNKNK